jgi:hypothetical protein
MYVEVANIFQRYGQEWRAANASRRNLIQRRAGFVAALARKTDKEDERASE